MDEVNQQPFDVRAVIVLIGHYHDRAIAQALHVLVYATHLNPQDLNKVLDLRVLHDLLVRCLAHVQKFAAKREHTIVVTTDDLNAGKG